MLGLFHFVFSVLILFISCLLSSCLALLLVFFLFLFVSLCCLVSSSFLCLLDLAFASCLWLFSFWKAGINQPTGCQTKPKKPNLRGNQTQPLKTSKAKNSKNIEKLKTSKPRHPTPTPTLLPLRYTPLTANSIPTPRRRFLQQLASPLPASVGSLFALPNTAPKKSQWQRPKNQKKTQLEGLLAFYILLYLFLVALLWASSLAPHLFSFSPLTTSLALPAAAFLRGWHLREPASSVPVAAPIDASVAFC